MSAARVLDIAMAVVGAFMIANGSLAAPKVKPIPTTPPHGPVVIVHSGR